MAVRNSGGHGVTGTLPSNSDGVQVKAAQPKFIPTQGPAAYAGKKGKGKGGTPYK